MLTRMFACVVVAAMALMASAEEKKFACTCPVSGQPAKESSAVDHMGKKVYFCCDNCPKAYKADPKKFATKVHHQLAQTGQAVQVGCPISGQPVNAEKCCEVAGVKVAFCCGNCLAKAEKADDKMAMLFGDISKSFTLQTICPVSKKAIDPTVSVTVEGKKIFLCCEGCIEPVKANPEKYAK